MYYVLMFDEITAWLKENRYTAQTIHSYGYYLTKFDAWLKERGYRDESEITPHLLQAYLEDEGHAWHTNTQGVAWNAIAGYLRWKFGEHSALTLRPPRGPVARRRRVITEAKLEKLLTYLNETPSPINIRDAAMCTLLIDTGIRVSELVGLQINDLDPVAQDIFCRRKGGKFARSVYTDVTAAYLKRWLDIRKLYAEKRVMHVFVGIAGNTPGQPMTRDGLKKNFRELGQRAGIGHMSPHDFRRGMATQSFENGAPTRLVQGQGAWDSASMINTYTTELSVEHVRKYLPMNKFTPPED